MDKIINGKRYDTGTAKAIVTHWDVHNFRVYRNLLQELYRKKNGEYFLFCESSEGLECGWPRDCMRNENSTITPMTREEAERFGAAHLTADEYEELFGPCIE